MGGIVAVDNITLDGVLQAPGRPDEDRGDGFAHGGWAVSYNDDVMLTALGDGIRGRHALLFGRRTYQDFASFWPGQRDSPFTDVLTRAPKYVVSTTLREPLPWQHSTVLRGDVAEEVAGLKQREDGDIVLFGSGELTQELMRHGLIDRYVLLIHPLVPGSGRRLFTDGGPAATLRLVDTVPTTIGVIIATYEG